MTLLSRFDARAATSVDVAHLAWLRLALGPIALLHLQPFLARAVDGVTYRDRFHVAWVPWLPELAEPLYVAGLWSAAVAAVMLGLGWRTRLAAWWVACVVAYNLLVSQTHYSNNRAFLLVLLVAVAVLPTAGAPSVDAWLARHRDRPAPSTTTRQWVLDLVRVEVAVVYLASGVSKLLDPDWWGGAVLRLRVERGAAQAVADGVPDGLIELLVDPTTMWWVAKAVVLTELFIGTGLWWRRSRPYAVAVAIAFHLAIEVSAAVGVFSSAAVAALVLWRHAPSADLATGSLLARRPSIPDPS